jgi:probable addiction module antidote protein
VNEPVKSAAAQSRRDIADRMNRAFETCDLEVICQAIGEAVRLHNISDVARMAGLERPSIYRAFGGRQSPNLSTVLGVLKAIGFQLKVTQLRGKRARIAKPGR